MTKTLHRVLGVLAVLAIGLLPLTATAGSITYTESFMASGTVNGTPFDGNVMARRPSKPRKEGPRLSPAVLSYSDRASWDSPP